MTHNFIPMLLFNIGERKKYSHRDPSLNVSRCLFIASSKWKQLKCSPTDEWINQCVTIYPHRGILLSRKKGLSY